VPEKRPRGLESVGASVVGLPVCRCTRPVSERAAVRLIRHVCKVSIDAVTFTSAPAVTNLVEIAARRELAAQLLGAFNHDGVVAARVGPVCAEHARRHRVQRPVAPARTARPDRHRGTVPQPLGMELGWSARRFSRQPPLRGNERLRLSGAERRAVAAWHNVPGAVVAKTTLASQTRSTPGAVEAAIARTRARLGPCGR